MYKVYWTAQNVGYAPMCHSRDFDSDKMVEALDWVRELRTDPANSFVIMASENPNSVGKPGVAVAGSDYNWTKRRDGDRVPGTTVTRRNWNSDDEREVPLDDE